jgi:hypothetical protein
VKEDVRCVREDVAQTKGIAQDTQRHVALLGGDLQKVAFAVDSVYTDVGTFGHEVSHLATTVADVRHGLDGLATTEDIRRIEIQMRRLESRLIVEPPFKPESGLDIQVRTTKGRETAARGM